MQIGLIFWPISNYATLTYLLFYLPLFTLFFLEHKRFSQLYSHSNRAILIVLFALLSWVVISCFWSNTEDDLFALLAKTIKHNLLIITYVLGVAFVARQSSKLLFACLVTGSALVTTIALASMINQYTLNDLPITSRMTTFGVGNRIIVLNSVAAGIYFGVFSVFSGTSVFSHPFSKNLALSALMGLVFLMCFLATYLTGTRTALLALFTLLIVSLLLSRMWVIALCISAGFLVLLLYVFLGETSYLKDFLSRGGLGSWRPQIWLAAWQYSTEHFWFGTGMWESIELETTRKEVTTTMPHSHNFYLQLLNWTGIIGLSLYLSVLILTLKTAMMQLNKPLVFISTMILIYFLVVQIFDVFNVFTKPAYYWPCLWLPLGIIIGQTIEEKTEE